MSSSGKFPKRYNLEIEQDIYDYREANDLFSPEKIIQLRKEKGLMDEGVDPESFMIPLPPPNVTGSLHVGHSLMVAIEDAMVRYHRMKGKKALWIPGTDHAGISTQVKVEKLMKQKEGLTRHDVGRSKMLDRIWDFAKQSRSNIINQTKKLGASCDRSREQFTLSEKLSRAVRKAFSNLEKQDKIYRDSYIINWCPRCETVLSDIELEHEEKDSKLYYIRYFIKNKGYNITVATTRPETMFGDVAIAVHPDDKQRSKYIGRDALIPIINKPIPIIANENVDQDFGTGALKITPAHAPEDYEIGKKHDLPLDQFAIDKEGKYTDLAGEEFEGLDVYDSFENLIHYIDEIGNLGKTEDYENEVPLCERCGTRIQPMVSKQWFVDVDEYAKKSLEDLDEGKTIVHGDRFEKTFYDWLEDIRPWCISRQLWWGHRIPVWTCENDHDNVWDEDTVLEQDIQDTDKHSILSLIVFNLIADSRLDNPFNIEQLVELLYQDSLTPQKGLIYEVYLNTYKKKYKDKNIQKEIKKLKGLLDSFDSVDDIVGQGGKLIDIIENSQNIKIKEDMYEFVYTCNECESSNLKQDEDVLDTWFSSGLRPFSILGWPEQTEDLEEYYPNDVLETGYDIIFFWVIRMMIMGHANMEQKPFDNVYLHGLVRDQKGRKMSKSLGNVVDPLDIVEDYGADALRLSLVVGSSPGNDVKFSEKKVEYNSRFINKLWNACRFVHMQTMQELGEDIQLDHDAISDDIESNIEKLNDFDQWMIQQLNDLIAVSERFMDKFMIGELGKKLIDTTWHSFCDWYIELSKLEKSEYTDKVLMYTIGTLLKMLHPFTPFVTEKLRDQMNFRGDLIYQNYPTQIKSGEKNFRINFLMDVISEFRSIKQQNDIKPHQKVDVFLQTEPGMASFLQEYNWLLEELINTKSIEYFQQGDNIKPDYQISMVLDSKIGLKSKEDIDWHDKLDSLKTTLGEEKQFLQSLRSTLSNSAFVNNAPDKVVEQKKEKMKEVKSKITKIKHEIDKIKMKVK